MSAISKSAAALPGTPKTEAGPDVNVEMPIFNSAGLSWAKARPVLNASAIMAVSVVSRFMLSPVDLSKW